ncbi:hypothetical protein N7474_002138 [Penicillium riverlandense]|uniref:uncharacterized protein n=1 Tax=Penicillium riverlandense TaxID=1903569 RepID=UPI002546E2F1|nr:uncharacterized protein N7474_002138 [Penicillium riverlandense]KAJ5833827.1 hypothetical protein N7474_002138 [Penicillium riverlandense]
MSSGYNLRAHIHAPQRFCEADFESFTETPTAAVLQSMRSARSQSEDGDGDKLFSSLPDADSRSTRGHHVSQLVPRIAPFNPNLEPAAFPSLKDPRVARNGNHANGQEKQQGQAQTLQQQQQQSSCSSQNGERCNGASTADCNGVGLQDVPMDEVDNRAASNSALNAVYAGNMAVMSGANAKSPETVGQNGYPPEPLLDFEDSDLEEQVDASEVLLAKTRNPKWSDLNPAVQVEILENLLQIGCWRTTSRKLGLGAEDRKKLTTYLDTRNQQIARENKQLGAMRTKQLRALLRVDHSILERTGPPPHLIINKTFRQTTRFLRESYHTDLLMCRAADFLAARQFLHQHGIPRRFAGDWGNSLVVLRESGDDSLGPETFEWKEDLARGLKGLDEADGNANGVHNDQITIERREFIDTIGLESTINPKDLIRRPEDAEALLDWGRYFPHWRPYSRSNPKRRRDGLVRLQVGVQGAAQIQNMQERHAKIRPRTQRSQMSSPPARLDATPSKVYDNSHTFEELSRAITMSLPPPTQMPLTRILGGRWSLKAANPALGQARYRQQIEQARLESQQRKEESERIAAPNFANVPPVAGSQAPSRAPYRPASEDIPSSAMRAAHMANRERPTQRDVREEAIWRDLQETMRADLAGCEEADWAFIHEGFVIPDEDPAMMDVEEVNEEMDIKEMAAQYTSDSEASLSDPSSSI